jgi:hypothetical protein
MNHPIEVDCLICKKSVPLDTRNARKIAPGSTVEYNISSLLKLLPGDNAYVCYRCYRASENLSRTRDACKKAETYFLSCNGLPEQTSDLSMFEMAILRNVKTLYQTLDKFSPFRSELRHYIGKDLPEREVQNWFEVSARSVIRSREPRFPVSVHYLGNA